MSYRRRGAPVSTLRARLQQRLEDKNSWEGKNDFDLGEEEAGVKPFFPAVIFKSMHRYFLVKVTLAVAVVFAAAFLIWSSYSWGEPLLQALRFVVEWDLQKDWLPEQAAPAFRLIRDHLVLSPLEPGGAALPFAGTLESGYGPRAGSPGARDQMHYGIDLVAPRGTAVRAIHGGTVERVGADAGGGEDLVVVVIAMQPPGWTALYRGLVAAGVKEGQSVEPGSLLGKLGPPRLYDLPHLHFELRYDGRPVPPPDDWVALFSGDTAL